MLNLTQLAVLDAVARHGSVTGAAQELHYSQPSVSHHLARLEAATGAKLTQRVGRGIRLSPAGALLAQRAREIVGRVDAAAVELATNLGLRAGRVRLAGFQTALSTIVPSAVDILAGEHPAIEVNLVDVHPGDALQLLRDGKVDVAVIFRGPDTPGEEDGFRLVHLLDDPVYLLTRMPGQQLDDHRDSPWIGGCERCRATLVSLCESHGFTPRIAFSSDDMVVVQALVAAGMGVGTLPGLALQSHRIESIHAIRIADSTRSVFAVTYGDPPDPPATAALINALRGAAAQAAATHA